MTPAAALVFREEMRGAFAAGATDPAAGERDGRRAGSDLVFQVEAAIPDVREFVRSPAHAGELTGTVTFRPLDIDRAPSRGVFRLFTPSPDPGVKLMEYQATFRAGAADYCLSGAKRVRRQSVLRAWPDTTTLYGRLHEGADATGRVVAAGVLRLAPLAFLRQVASFRTPSARGPVDGASALATFLWFFSGELLDTYVSRRPAR